MKEMKAECLKHIHPRPRKMGGRGSGRGGQEGGEWQILSKRVGCHVVLKLTAGTLSLFSGVLRERHR